MNIAVISRIADAIAFSEGYFVSGSRPRRNNNPGDLERDLHLGVTVETRLDQVEAPISLH